MTEAAGKDELVDQRARRPEDPPAAVEAGCCANSSPRLAGARLRQVIIAGGTTMYLEVRAYCSACRLVLVPRMQAFVPEAEAANDARLDDVFAKSPLAINRAGIATADALGLPTWDQVVDSCGATLVHKRELWTDYERIPDRKMRVGRMGNLLGFARSTPRRSMKSPFPINPADPEIEPFADIETINHFLDPKNIHRSDGTMRGSNHMRYWPLLAPTAEGPIEVWEVPASDPHNQGKGPALLFLRPYRVGALIRTHMVVVKKANGWLITGYVLDEIQSEEKRNGTLVYVNYTTEHRL